MGGKELGEEKEKKSGQSIGSTEGRLHAIFQLRMGEAGDGSEDERPEKG